MKRLPVMVALLIMSSFLGFRPGSGEEGGGAAVADDVERLLTNIELEWSKAYVDRDTAAMERIEADDYVSTGADGSMTTKKDDVASVAAGDFKAESMTPDDMKVRIYGDAAVVTGRETMKARYKGEDLSGKYRWTDVFVKRRGRWQIVADHESRIAPE